MTTDTSGSGLSPGRHDTLDALVRTLLPHALKRSSPVTDVTQLVAARIANAPPAVRDDLLAALDALGNRVAGFLVTGRVKRFTRLPDEERSRYMETWSASWIPVARSVHQALRKLVLSTWYGTPEARSDLGVRVPLHLRTPAVSWEGPLTGLATDSDPVARLPAGHRIPGVDPGARPLPAAVVTAQLVPRENRISADVVIIGSGAGGAVAAARLAAAGREVVILESGEYLHAPDFTEDEGHLVSRLYADQAMRATTDGAFTLLQGGAAGGGTTVNWMLTLRPPESVLDAWARMGISGYSLRDLAPHLATVEDEIHARTVPPDAHTPSNLALLEGTRRLGWRAAAASVNAKGCVRAGTCSLGCRYDAKQSALLTYLPRAFAAGARLFANTSVDRIEVVERDQGGTRGSPPLKRVVATVGDPLAGVPRRTLVFESPVVALAAGGVATPAILQRSGLGGGGVGRYLRLHPTTAVMGHYARETYPLAGIPQTALCDEFLRRDAHGFGFWIECPALQPALAAAALPGFGDAHRAFMSRLNHTVSFIVLVRDGSGSSQSMGSVWIDRRGRTRVRYRMTRADMVNARLGIEAAARIHLAAGAEVALSLHAPPRVARSEADLAALRDASVAPNRVTWFSAHVNGTCRLGTSPATSGTTPDAERHGVRGLYVCDGSLLPTSLGVNPQLTIMAMASLVAERIAR